MADQPQQPPVPPEKKQTKAVPGKPVEGTEPRKETVRINLPPKLGEGAKPAGPAPTVRLPGPEAAAGQPGATTGQAATVKAAVPAPTTQMPKKSDTAQVITTPAPTTPAPAPAPTVPLTAPKPTVRLKPVGAATSAALTPAPPAQTTVLPAPPAVTVPAPALPAKGSGFESVLALVTAVLALAVVVVLILAM